MNPKEIYDFIIEKATPVGAAIILLLLVSGVSFAIDYTSRLTVVESTVSTDTQRVDALLVSVRLLEQTVAEQSGNTRALNTSVKELHRSVSSLTNALIQGRRNHQANTDNANEYGTGH